jgi:hypothetical protein
MPDVNTARVDSEHELYLRPLFMLSATYVGLIRCVDFVTMSTALARARRGPFATDLASVSDLPSLRWLTVSSAILLLICVVLEFRRSQWAPTLGLLAVVGIWTYYGPQLRDEFPEPSIYLPWRQYLGVSGATISAALLAYLRLWRNA